MRIGLNTRLATIAVVAMLTGWLAMLGFTFRTTTDDGGGIWPSPARLAAIVRLVEGAAADDRATVLAAIASPWLSPAIGNGPPPEPDLPALLPAERMVGPIAAALDGRPVRVTVAGRVAPLGLLTDRREDAGLVIAIGLRTGETLVLTLTAPRGVTRFGLPVGLGAGLIGLVIALTSLLLTARETRPIARLAAAVDRMNPEGEPVALPALGGAPEVRALVAAFGRLQERLSQLVRARMVLLGGISHDLRTYATRLRLRVEGIADEDERQRAIADISDVIRLLDDALLASRTGARELSEELLELDEVVAAEVDDRRRAGTDVALRIAPSARGVAVIGDRIALRRIVGNLVDNAVKYGVRAEVSLDRDGDRLRLVVDDRGAGIPVAERDGLMEPFVRRETSRNRATGGAGLGLAIARGLAEAHGGTLRIGDAPSGGARLVVDLPVFTGA